MTVYDLIDELIDDHFHADCKLSECIGHVYDDFVHDEFIYDVFIDYLVDHEMAISALRPSTWSTADDVHDVETRGGVPIYWGDAASFDEWEFRLRAKVESQDTEAKRQAWTVRAVEGLR